MEKRLQRHYGAFYVSILKFFITFILYILISLKDTLSRLPTASNCVSYFYE